MNQIRFKKYSLHFLFLSLFLVDILWVSSIQAQERLYTNEFPLADVSLLDGPFLKARELNIKTLLKYHPDQLLAPYRKQAGLIPKDSSYHNWEGLDGHIGGHYLSAMAMNYAATGNNQCKKILEYMIAELQACQKANAIHHPDWGIGYVGGVPNSKSIWSTLKKGDFKAYHAAWVPWYNVHKMYAGLRDAWLYAQSEKARIIFLNFCEWAIQITSNLNENQMQSMLDTEQGGMNEVLADAYSMTGSEKYLIAAKRFSHKMLLDPMADGVDKLDNLHANTQIPKAIGFQRIGELSGDKKYKMAGSFFWETVTTYRSLAFGGNSRREFFPTPASSTDYVEDVEGPESCNSYNMLKLTEGLFRGNPSAPYMDYYERTLYNHILSTQNPETGGYVYFTPVRPRSYKVYSSPNQAMWCCVGSGMENHGKYNELIYTHSRDSLFLNLYIASELNWREKKIRIKQETQFPFQDQTRFTVLEGASPFTLLIRYPAWVEEGKLEIYINGKSFPYSAHPSSYIAIRRDWKKGDRVQLVLPMHTVLEYLPNVPTYIAMLHGPIVLGAKSGTEDMKGLFADASRWGQIPSGEKLALDKAPIILSDSSESLTDPLFAVPGKPLHFTLGSLKMVNPSPLELEPFFQIYNSRYMLYWMKLSPNQYQLYLDSLAGVEKENLNLSRRTLDFVAPGEQQPEVDHKMESFNSLSGTLHAQLYREASNGGFFSYSLATQSEKDLSVMVRYWGAEWGNRKLDIYLDNELLVKEDRGKENISRFREIEYKIPNSMIIGKDHIRLKVQSLRDNSTGGVYYIRLVKKKV